MNNQNERSETVFSLEQTAPQMIAEPQPRKKGRRPGTRNTTESKAQLRAKIGVYESQIKHLQDAVDTLEEKLTAFGIQRVA